MRRGRVTTQKLELGRDVAISSPFGLELKTHRYSGEMSDGTDKR
jgi:hypothetical protein